MAKKIEFKKGQEFKCEFGTSVFLETWYNYADRFDIFRFEPNDGRPNALLAYGNKRKRPFHCKEINGQIGIMQSFYTECIAMWNKK